MIDNSSTRRLVLIGVQNPDGTASGTMQALETLNGFAMKPTGESKKRELVRASMSPVGSVIGAKHWEITLPLEVQAGGLDSSGVLQNSPLHPALMACGLVQEAAASLRVNIAAGALALHDELSEAGSGAAVGTVVHSAMTASGETQVWLRDVQNLPAAGDLLSSDKGVDCTVVSVEAAQLYRPTSNRSDHHTCLLHAHFDGQRRIASQARGTLQFDWTAGAFCTIQFTLQGLYEKPSNQPLPDADFGELLPPMAESAGLTLGNYPTDLGTIEKLSFQQGNEVVPVADINSPDGRHSFRIRSRNPNGSIDPEVVALNDFDPFALWADGEKAALHLTLGDQPGERCSIVLPAIGLTSISDKERSGLDAWDLPFEATGRDDDEFFLFFH